MIDIDVNDIVRLKASLSKKAEGTPLPAEIEALTEQRRNQLVDYRNSEAWEITDYGARPEEFVAYQLGAFYRSEIDSECSCAGGRPRQTYRHRESGLEVRITFRLSDKHSYCQMRDLWPTNVVQHPSWLVPRFSDHRLHTIAPFHASPITTEGQATLLHELRIAMANVILGTTSGVIFSGPAGTGKSTLLNAIMFDLWTYRRAHALIFPEPEPEPKPELSIWRVMVPDWLDEMNAYDTRAFHKEMDPPSITPAKIRASVEKSGWTPVIWLDEVDKFNPTPTRLNYLLRLVNTVYEFGGVILSSANMTLDQLREHLQDPIYRRLVGTNDEEGTYEVFDLHSLLDDENRRKKKKSVKPKAA